MAAAFVTVAGVLGYLAESRVRRGPAEHPHAPNVVVISVDTLRADFVGAYGADAPTPAMDALAARGVVLENAVSHAPLTLPAHASMLTGTYPTAHGLRDNGGFTLEAERTSVAELFLAAGYRTAAFVGAYVLDSRFGLDQGFETYDDEMGRDDGTERRAREVLRAASRWIGERREHENWFVFVHLYDVHAPYHPPAPFDAIRGEGAYRSEVAYVDHELGLFFDALFERGLGERTLVVLTSDHGEGLGEHGESTHGMFAYDATLRVPLIFSWPGVLPSGNRVGARARHVDVAPTLAELAGLAGSGFHGESLAPYLRSHVAGAGRKSEDRDSYFEAIGFSLNRGTAPLTGLYRDRFKYIELPIPELYDLVDDPKEIRNLVESEPLVAAEMAASLRELVASSSSPRGSRVPRAELDDEAVAKLRSLGYLVTRVPPGEAPAYGPEDDPKRVVDIANLLDEAVQAHQKGDDATAIRLFETVLARRPTNGTAYLYLASVLKARGEMEGALAVLQRALARGVQTPRLLSELGETLHTMGQFEASIEVYESLVDQGLASPASREGLAIAYALTGRYAEAEGTLLSVLALEPDRASAFANLGAVYQKTGRLSEAERAFVSSLEYAPALVSASRGLGEVYLSLGRLEAAVIALERTVRLDPRDRVSSRNLALALKTLGRHAEAIHYLERATAVVEDE